ncbi:MAG: hypothetical protein AAGB00_08965 [Planctomycetota bacterium]
MRRADQASGDVPGQDSFLDIVANLVGILILLVMVVGLRAAQQPASATADGAPSTADASPATPGEPADKATGAVTEEELAAAVKKALLQRREVVTKLVKVASSKEEVALRDAERVELTKFVAGVEEEIETQRQAMSVGQRRDFDLQAKISAAQHELSKLTRERMAVIESEPEVEQLESLPTPLAKRAGEDQIYLRLSGGYVRVIPWDELMDLAQDRGRLEVSRLRSRDRVTFTVGPVGGFRLRCEMRKRVVRTSQGTFLAPDVAVEFLPEQELLGEPVADAIQPGSLLMTEIAARSGPRKPTITVGTYPDSFGEFRQLKATLHELGFPVAGRPVSAGKLIGASPNGTASAAQ